MTSDKTVSWRLVDSYLLVNGNKVFLTCVTGLPSPIPGINPLHVLPSFSLFPFQRRMKTWLLWAQAPFLSALRNLAHRSAISMAWFLFLTAPPLFSRGSCEVPLHAPPFLFLLVHLLVVFQVWLSLIFSPWQPTVLELPFSLAPSCALDNINFWRVGMVLFIIFASGI